MKSYSLYSCLKFIGYFPDYLSALSRTPLRLFWTTFVKTAVCLQVLFVILVILDTSFAVSENTILHNFLGKTGTSDELI